jgi:pimeloyl-ACP methyl ester carboxylesterase
MALNYERRGSGETVVLLHGIGHHWQAWLPVMDRLAAGHDVIAVDLPGFGRSPRVDTDAPAHIGLLVDALGAFFTELGLERPHVAGNSLGGALSLELAMRGQVSSATTFSPAGFARPWELRYALTVLRAHRAATRSPERVLERVMTSPAGRTAAIGMIVGKPRQLSPDAAISDAQALRDAVSFGEVARAAHGYEFHGRPDVPVTVAWGSKDKILLLRQSGRARDRLPGARHVTLDGCGHVPMSDDPDAVAGLITETVGAHRAG